MNKLDDMSRLKKKWKKQNDRINTWKIKFWNMKMIGQKKISVKTPSLDMIITFRAWVAKGQQILKQNC